MNKVNRLLAKHGEEIRESLGSRSGDTLELVQDEQAPSRFARRRKAKGACVLDVDQIIAVEQHRQVLTQRYRQDRTREEIATQLQVKQNTISVMLRRIRRALGDCVRERMGGATR